MMKKYLAFLAAMVCLGACGCTPIENVPAIADEVISEESEISEGSDEIYSETAEEITAHTEISEETTVFTETDDTALYTETAAETEESQTEETMPASETESEYLSEPTETIMTADEDDEDISEIEKIELTFYEVTLYEGESKMPIVTMYPEDASDKSEIWTSSDESVAEVDGLGNITAVSEGSCVITVQSAVSPEVSASVDVRVKKSVSEVTYIDGILIANKSYALPADYNPGENKEARAAFDKMRDDAAEEGLNIYISSGFRSYDYQKGLYERYVERSGKSEADRYSARPGHSEHQTGLAFDLNTIDDSFADTDEYVWVKKHCAEYGFIIRYPEGKESITGYMYEPWHLRYLGIETAQRVYESGLTLEEYLGIDSKYDE